MSKQHTLGPAMRVKARAKQAKPSEIEAQRRESSHEAIDNVQTMIEKGCRKPCRAG
jgi:hypothetical protein